MTLLMNGFTNECIFKRIYPRIKKPDRTPPGNHPNHYCTYDLTAIAHNIAPKRTVHAMDRANENSE